MSKIPSDEDFAKAKQRMRELDRNLSQVNENALRYFKKICPAHCYKFYLIAENDKQFRAYIFYKNNGDIQTYGANGVAQKMMDFVYAELERQGRGNTQEIMVEFEFDSDENVVANYEGDYYLRLR